MVQYILTNSLQKKEILFSSSITKLSRSQLSLFRLNTEIDGNIITCYAQLLTSKERISDRTYGFLPTIVSQQRLRKMLIKNVANYEQWRERHFFSDLKVCEHLASLERVLEVDLNIASGGEVILSEFRVSHREKSLKQDNGTDCGIYVMKHMQHLTKKTTSLVEKDRVGPRNCSKRVKQDLGRS
ncbi:uncharacterized protein LOC133829670 isoform X2 [Humulus lupulus]|uniref:uncharacterized protein LOC133829670 isoform X2 n=1 Tax=Humulus lupulus TaxID=3486 RepID=UPI002B40E515|nr:uncharacterized protein LOC133829670 isoform X2 [Humulus lupulus]